MDEDKSILDQITGSVPRLQKGLGAKDRTRMNEYLENIREIERRLQIAEKRPGSQVACRMRRWVCRILTKSTSV